MTISWLTADFRITRFYERRVRRILPAFVIVTAGTIIAGFFLFLPGDFAALGQSVVYSSAFAANIYFYLTSGYFDGAAITKPLLHYWSLGVEEQFYIVFPLMVLAVTKLAPRFLALAVLLIAAFSFASAQYYVANAPTAAFYLAPQRAWELMAGSLLALPGFPLLKRRWSCEVLAALGLALVLVAAAAYDSETPFPGMTAAVPVLGAASIIWACEGKATLVGAVLSVRPLRYVGLWSYSIYMIHWPLIVSLALRGRTRTHIWKDRSFSQPSCLGASRTFASRRPSVDRDHSPARAWCLSPRSHR